MTGRRGWKRIRLRRASMLAVMVFALLLAGAGFAIAASPEASLPETFSVAPFHEGDRGRYTALLDGGWLDGGPEDGDAVMAFEHAGHDAVLDARGRFVEADVLRVQGLAYSGLPEGSGADTWFAYLREQHLAPDGSRIAEVSGDEDTATVSEDDLPVLETRSQQTTTSRRMDYPDGPERDCVLSAPFGPAASTAAPGRLAAACEVTGLQMRLPAGTPIESLGFRTVEGVRTLAFGASTDDVWLTWHYVPDIPVPLRLEGQADSPYHDEPRRIRLDLDAFERGGAVPHPLSVAGAVAVEMGPVHVWGPEDRDLDHPFPLHEAFRRANTDPDWTDLQDWRQAHINGYVFKTGYREKQTDDGAEYTWQIHMSDGEEGFSFRVTGRPADPIMALARSPMEVSFQRHHEPDSQAPDAPHVDRLPAQLPTIESLWKRWQYHAPPSADDPRAYSFMILSDRAGDPVIRFMVGAAAEMEWGRAGGLRVAGEDVAEAGHATFTSILVTDGAARALHYEELDRTTEQRASVLTPPPPPRGTGNEALAQASAAPRSDPFWHVPGAAQSAGIGLAALLVAAVYWAWPALKAAPLALFSRIHGDELLEHRTRARIMDTVRSEPGIHFRGLAGRLGVNPGQVRHHVRKLVDGRHLVETKGAGYTCYYPYKGTARNLMHAGPVLRAESAQHILAALREHPGASGKELAATAGLSPATTNYHLKRLLQAGLVSSRRDGRSLAVHLTSDGRQAVDAMLA